MRAGARVCVCVCAYMCVCVCVHVHARTYMPVFGCVCVFEKEKIVCTFLYI